MTSDSKGFAKVLSEMTEDELAITARDYTWLAEFGPQARFPTFHPQRDAVVREFERRCITERLERIRGELMATAPRSGEDRESP